MNTSEIEVTLCQTVWVITGKQDHDLLHTVGYDNIDLLTLKVIGVYDAGEIGNIWIDVRM